MSVVDDAGNDGHAAASRAADREPRAARDRDAVRGRRRRGRDRGGRAQRLAPAGARAAARGRRERRIDLESIVALQPDLVVAWPYTAPPQLAALRALGMPVFFSHPRTIGGIAADIERLGTLAGTQAQAHQSRECAAGASGARLRAKYAQARDRCGVLRSLEPAAVHHRRRSPGHGGDRHMRRRNVFATLALPAPAVSLEAVIAAAPQVIVGADDAGARPAWLSEWLQWPDLPAVRDGNVYRCPRRPAASAGPALRRRRGEPVRGA